MTPRKRTARRAGVVLLATALVVGVLALGDRVSIERGNRAFRAGDPETAVETYAPLSGDPAVAYNLGTALMGLDPDSASAVLRSAAEAAEDPATRQRSLYNLGYHLITRLGGLMVEDSIRAVLDEAVAVNRLALRLDPTDENARWNLAVAQRRLDAMVPPGEETGKESSGESEDEIAMNDPQLARSENAPAESGLEPEDPRAADNSGERSGPLQGAREAWATQDPGRMTRADALGLLIELNDEPELLLRGVLWSHRPDVAWWSGQAYPGGRW